MTDRQQVDDAGDLLKALGGTRGLLDSGLPALVFVVAFTIRRDLQVAIIASVALAFLLAAVRLARRDTLQHALSGLFGVVICAVIARASGRAADFYLPGLIINVVYGFAYAIANLVKWPVLGLVLGPILGEGTAWRRNPARMRAYVLAGWIWVAMFVSRILVQYPLYASDSVTALGIARVAMGWPLFLLAGYLTWLILRRVPAAKATDQ
jgi:hypothetical protein